MIATRSFPEVEICIDSLTAFHRYSDLSKDFYASKRVTWINFDTDAEQNKEREMFKKILYFLDNFNVRLFQSALTNIIAIYYTSEIN